MNGSPPAETRIRECDCPPWIGRCVHFGAEERLVLNEVDGYLRTHRADCMEAALFEIAVPRGIYSVHLTPGPSVSGCDCKVASLTPPEVRSAFYFGPDYDDALRAFHDAEQRLLAGDAP